MNEKDGADAKDWKAGKPVRVVRSSKGRKHSKFCPEDGNRYDGIYKVGVTARPVKTLIVHMLLKCNKMPRKL